MIQQLLLLVVMIQQLPKFNSQFFMLGVVNITPNSFSDAAKSLDKTVLTKQLEEFLSSDNCSIDVGAQSTAPFNSMISADDELARLEKYFFNSADWQLLVKARYLSVDTYYPSVFRQFYQEAIKNGVKASQLIWNDVSGQVDDEALSLLQETKKVNYVLSHNLCPDRLSTNKHMDFVNPSLETKDVISFFERGMTKLAVNGVMPDRVILDPCFGFSKNQEQNYMLIRDSRQLFFSHKRWLLGVSKKSFLQALCSSHKKDDRLKESECYHQQLLVKFMNDFTGHELLLRVHDQEVFNRAVLAWQNFY
jgi:dihydropteroate synthase